MTPDALRGPQAPATDAPGVMTASRWPTAVHEAGHFLASYFLLGQAPEVVSVRPAEAHSGVNIRSAQIDFTGHPAELPLPLADPRLRSLTERHLLVFLAGQAAERLVPRLGFVPDPEPAAAAERLAESLARLSPRHVELLADAESRPAPESPFESDDEEALRLALRLAGQEARLHVAWLSAVADRFVERFAPLVAALARELMARTVMSGDEAVNLIEGRRHPDPPVA